MDGAITLARSPELNVGWHLTNEEIDFEHEDDFWTPPAHMEDDRVRFRRELLGSRQKDSALIRLLNSPAAFSDAPILRLRTASAPLCQSILRRFQHQ